MIYTPRPREGVALYIHIPFCNTLCPYCHFFRVPLGPGEEEPFLEAVLREAASLKGVAPGPVRTVYIGGGTPSLLPPSFYTRLFEAMDSVLPLDRTVEMSLEADAGVSDEELAQLAEAGFDRVSIGVKSFQESGVRMLGAGQWDGDRTLVVSRARKAGFPSVGIDLIYGFEGQGIDDFRTDLKTALAVGPDHISLYALEANDDKGPREVDGDLAAAMFRMARRMLPAGGYGQYEICNFALPGHECLHNINYWCDGDYFGLGPSAHGSLTVKGTRERFSNRPDLAGYLAHPEDVRETLSGDGKEDRAREALILRLRLAQGVEVNAFTMRYGVDPLKILGPALDEFRRMGLIRTTPGRIRLTTRGMLLSNEIFTRVI
ncbi:MAG: radical SAM family heme chaperone HemW [Deltaproteobacteria bacterium]|nr:radical SAM family heme chaperone HemW [Deltaproteobacteria bacterium]